MTTQIDTAALGGAWVESSSRLTGTEVEKLGSKLALAEHVFNMLARAGTFADKQPELNAVTSNGQTFRERLLGMVQDSDGDQLPEIAVAKLLRSDLLYRDATASAVLKALERIAGYSGVATSGANSFHLEHMGRMLAPTESALKPNAGVRLTAPGGHRAPSSAKQRLGLVDAPGARRIPRGGLSPAIGPIAPPEFGDVEGIFFAWVDGPQALVPMIKEVANDDIAVIAVNPRSAAYAKTTLHDAGVNLDNVRFLETVFLGKWIRDYGPHFVYTPAGDVEAVDFKYTARGRYIDGVIPRTYAATQDMPVRSSPLVLSGGNLIVADGIAFMSEAIFSAEGQMWSHRFLGAQFSLLTKGRLLRELKQLLGIERLVIVPQLSKEETGHIDIFATLVDEHTFLVGEYANSDSGARGDKATLDMVANTLAKEENGRGQRFTVHRIPMPPADVGGGYTVTYTYTNSLILNNKVFVPQYGVAEDKVALDVYREVMPNHTIFGFDALALISEGGSIHCVTKAIMRDPLDIVHKPLPAPDAGQPMRTEFFVRSSKPIENHSAVLFWSLSPDGPFSAIPMGASRNSTTSSKKAHYVAEIPAQPAGTQVYYFARVSDNRGMYETWPERAISGGIAFSYQVHR